MKTICVLLATVRWLAFVRRFGDTKLSSAVESVVDITCFPFGIKPVMNINPDRYCDAKPWFIVAGPKRQQNATCTLRKSNVIMLRK